MENEIVTAATPIIQSIIDLIGASPAVAEIIYTVLLLIIGAISPSLATKLGEKWKKQPPSEVEPPSTKDPAE